ncbi:MAG: SpaA isopeptide-forming pilin-related protein [Bacteroides sp.]|nr:SpaA isopeptide-forming pilin-related protein [Bacteroides sp.]MCM1549652.1 SpaA isopeptide-forming pilin-related protein [Clostridium sp.]
MKQWKQIIYAMACMMVFLFVPQMAVQAQEMTTDMAGCITEEILPEAEEGVATSQREADLEEHPEPLQENDAEEETIMDAAVSTEAEYPEEKTNMEIGEEDMPMAAAVGDDMLHAMNIWNADGSHGSGSMTVWKNASTSVQAPQIMYAWIGGDSYSLFCIDYGKAAKTGDNYATDSDYSNLTREQKHAIGYVLGCAQRVQAPRNNGSFNEYGGEVTWENWRLYNSTQLMIWYYIDQYYEPGMNEGIGWDGVVQTCNAGWGDLAECERIKGIVDNLFTVPSFTSKRDAAAPSYRLNYNAATGQYEALLQDTNAVCTIGKFTWSGAGLAFTRCNASGVEDAAGTYLKVASANTITSGMPLVTTNQCEAQTGNITYVRNLTDAQDLILCTSSHPDPIQAFFKVYTESALQISKQDITTSAELPGATLQVSSTDGSVVYDTWVSGQTPHMIHGLASGTYRLTEVIAPEDYALAQSITFAYDADAGTVQTVVMKDAKTRVELLKTDEAGNPLSGATLEVYDAAGRLVDRWISRKNAHVLEGLAHGTYVLHEAKAPAGWVLAADVSFSVTNQPQTVRVVMENRMIQGRILIKKTGAQVLSAQEYTSIYGIFQRLTFGQRPLSGVVFGIYRADGTLVEKVATDADGLAESGSLPWGDYYIVELETRAGLVNTGEKLPVKLECPEDFQEAVYTAEVSVENAVGDTEINVYKRGEILNIEDGTYSFGTKPLEGVIFGVYAGEDILDYIGNVVIPKNGCIGFIRTGADGKAALKDALVEGSYYYREVKTLEGYILDDSRKEFTLTLGNETLNTMEVNKENPDVNQLYKTKLRIVKSDRADRGILLSGVEFELYNEKDELMGRYVTDEQGQILVDGLPYGSYYFKEIKTADGYIIDASKQVFTADSPEQMLEITNDRTPKTGDGSVPWLALLAGILSGIAFVWTRLEERRRKSH